MQTNRRTLFSCLSIVFAVAIFVISTNTTTAAETIPVSLIRPPTVYPSYRPLMVKCRDDHLQYCMERYNACRRLNSEATCQRDHDNCLRSCDQWP
jgi:hypothetical protein